MAVSILRYTRLTATSPVADRGPLDLTGAKMVSVTGNPIPGPLATARIIADISSVHYPEGIRGPQPELNKNAKEGKFRYVLQYVLYANHYRLTYPDMIESFYFNSCPFAS